MDESDFAALMYMAESQQDSEGFKTEVSELVDEMIPWLADKLDNGHRPMALWLAFLATQTIAAGLNEDSRAFLDEHRPPNAPRTYRH